MTLHNDQGYLKQLERQHGRYFHQLPSETQQSLQYYSGNGYQPINDYLRGLPVHPDDGSPEDFIQMIKNHIHRIEEALLGAPPLSKALEVYRGVRMPDSTQYNVGDVINLFQNGFISTSFNRDVSVNFAGKVCCLFVLYLPPNTHGLYLGKQSTRGLEYEYLLAPGASFQITHLGSVDRQLKIYHARCINCEERPNTPLSSTADNIDSHFLMGLSPQVIAEVDYLSQSCERNYLLNPRTNRCVRIDGKVGKAVLEELKSRR